MSIITLFKNAKETKTPYWKTVDVMLDRIKKCTVQKQIDLLRSEPDKKKKGEIKKGLPVICFSGKFTERVDKNCTIHSGFAILDFDHVENLQDKKEQMKSYPFVYSCFVSPSGDGLKVLVKIPANIEKHSGYYLGLQKTFPELDSTSKNISRACFESVDSDIYINKDAIEFIEFIDVKEPQKKLVNVLNQKSKNNYSKADIALKIIRDSVDGQKHIDLLKASKLMGGFIAGGIIDEIEAIHLLEKEISTKGCDDLDGAKITIKKGVEHGKGQPIRPTEYKKTIVEPIEILAKSKNISDFEKVENFLSDRYEVRFNEVSNEIEFRNKGEKTAFEVVNENNIYIELQKNFINFSQAKVTALLRSNYVTYYNPFKDYFENLGQWTNEEPDYILNICEYLPIKVSDKERFKIQFRKMLVRCIACALLDGVFNKQAFIIVHDQQNSGKSTFCRWLCPPTLSDYITENISTDKDSLICLSDNFIINMDELATLNKAEINTLKAMMSKDVVKVRRPYDKKPILTPRRASFVGSTNKSEFLSDETGSVRWICFELIGRINFNYKVDIDINNVWKQAYTLFKQGLKYELNPAEIEENEIVNRSYQITTEEQELIQKNYSPGTKEKHIAFYQASDFKRFLSEKYPNIRLNIITIGKALKILGFKQEQQMKDDLKYQIKGYFINFTDYV